MLSWLKRKPKRPSYYAEVLGFGYSDVDRAKRWWADVFGCEQTEMPDWDEVLPTDIAMRFPGLEEPTLWVADRAAPGRSGDDIVSDTTFVWTNDLKAAHEDLGSRGASPGPIQEGRVRSFEVRDPEGHVIEVCEE